MSELGTAVEERFKALNDKIEERTRQVDIKLKANDETIKTAKDVVDRRLHELNELRKEVMLDRDQFAKKEVYDTRINSLSRIVHIGLGALLAIQFMLKFFVK